MNIVLFEPTEVGHPLPRIDERARHILQVLRRQVGDEFDVGVVDGPRGKAVVEDVAPQALHLRFSWSPPHRAPATTALLLGLPRPQTARDILRDATTQGATALHFVSTFRSDPNYAASSLWQHDAWRRHALAGAAQAFDTHLPLVTWNQSFSAVLEESITRHRTLALDNYGASKPLHDLELQSANEPVAFCFGPERGWDDTDRDLLAKHAVERVHLGERVLRLETAVTAALTLLNAARERRRV